ncbi:unnamed protein product [Caenorhabditis bovis]|uniref:Serpentine receptor class r-10 n=1 Tax=Caenorhabditis bovis TaxID=2654633 RepID=A0A8S1EH96_9PELO|nr:unnamed protein product [Caenorhabditis bovis]
MTKQIIVILRIFQYAGFVGSQINNTLLFYLIFKVADKRLGRYRHLMSVFAIYGFVYSWIEIITQPIMHMKPYAFIVFLDGIFKYEKWIGNSMTTLYCGSFALCISVLGIQFVYRYIYLCRDQLKFYYDVDSHKVSFISTLFKSFNSDGTSHWNIDQIIGIIVCTTILVICNIAIVFCAFNTYLTMGKASSSMSIRTRELNKQLFTTLAFQTILPLVTIYVPVALILYLPIFGIEGGRLANLTSGGLGIYPALDPLIAIFHIRDFRNAVMCRKNRQNINIAGINGTPNYETYRTSLT